MFSIIMLHHALRRDLVERPGKAFLSNIGSVPAIVDQDFATLFKRITLPR